MKKNSHIVLSTNVVILAHFHNPSILNPDFLRINKIVDEQWEVLETITTAPFSQLRFQNGISITVDNERLNISETIKGDYPEHSKIYEIAKNYIKLLEHVKYTAVGLNWDILVPASSPTAWLTDHFFKKSSVPKSGPKLKSADLTMQFEIGEGLAHFKLSPAVTKTEENSIEAVRVNSNIHYPIDKLKNIQEILCAWKDTQKLIKQQITKLVNIK